MNIFLKIAEERIRQAMENGMFDKLSNSGKPLNLEDDAWIPDDLKMAYRMLKNAGFIPPELEVRKDIINLRLLVDTIDDEERRAKKLRELNYKIMHFNMMRNRPLYLEEYEDRVTGRLMGEHKSPRQKKSNY